MRRELTGKQFVALDCVAKRWVRARQVRNPFIYGGRFPVREWWALDMDFTVQIQALRRRGFIRPVWPQHDKRQFSPGRPESWELTPAGYEYIVKANGETCESSSKPSITRTSVTTP